MCIRRKESNICNVTKRNSKEIYKDLLLADTLT